MPFRFLFVMDTEIRSCKNEGYTGISLSPSLQQLEHITQA